MVSSCVEPCQKFAGYLGSEFLRCFGNLGKLLGCCDSRHGARKKIFIPIAHGGRSDESWQPAESFRVCGEQVFRNWLIGPMAADLNPRRKLKVGKGSLGGRG